MQNSVGETHGLGDYNPHYCAGMGEQNASRECRIAWGSPRSLEIITLTAATVWGSRMHRENTE